VQFISDDSREAGGGAALQQALANRRQRQSLVEDVVDQQHGSTAHRYPRLAVPSEGAAARLLPVATDIHIVEVERKAELRHQVSGKGYAAVHHAEQQRIAVAQLLADGAGDPADCRGDALGGMDQLGRSEDGQCLPRIDHRLAGTTVDGPCGAARWHWRAKRKGLTGRPPPRRAGPASALRR
jgi:hypothetical protein